MDLDQDQKNRYVLKSGQQAFILTVLTLLSVFCYADRSVLSAVLEPMKIALGLTDTEIGIVQSVFAIGVSVLSIPASFVVDRWSRRKALGLMAVIWSIATFTTGLASKFAYLLTSRFFVGIGEAGFSTGGSGWLSLAFSKQRRGIVTGVFSIGAVLGTVLGVVLGGYIVTKTGSWQQPFFYFAIPGIILGILVFFLKDYATVKAKGEGAFNKKFFAEWIRLFKIKSFTFTTIAQSFWALFYFTYLGFLPTLIMRTYQMDAHQATLIVGGAAMLAIVGSPLGGWLSDRWQKHNKAGRPYMMTVVQFSCLVTTVAVLFAMGGPLPLLIACIAIQSIIISTVNPLLQSLVTDVLPAGQRVSGHGITVTCIFLGVTLGPWIVGMISDAYGAGAAGLKTGLMYILPAFLIGGILYWINARYFYAKDSACVSDIVASEKGS